MTDYLLTPDDDNSNWMSGPALDDPAPPTAPPAPPAAPAGSSTGDTDWMTDIGGGYLSADEPPSAETAMIEDAAQRYFDEPVAPQHAMAAPAAPAPMHSSYPGGDYAAAPAVPMPGSLTVQAPHLEHVAPSHHTLGGTRGDLSELVLDVEVEVEVCFGDAQLTVEEFLDMGRGSVVELDHAIDTPVELRVKGKLVARGQLVSINGNYGLRITDMVGEH